MGVQVEMCRPSGASADRKLAPCFRGIAYRSKCFSEGIGDGAIHVRLEKQS